MVGDGQTMPKVREILAPVQCARFMTFTGLIPQAEAPAYLAASDIVVAPHVRNPDGSRFFGSPTKLFEYMAMGKGIVASDLEQIGEVLRDSLRTGELPEDGPGEAETALAVLATPGSPHELIQGMRFLVDHPEWRAVLGANARQRTLERYTWGRHVAAVVEALERVLEKESAQDTPCEP
jgi:glycosyltransferase involved in cell wall biosynthesis